MGYTKVIRSGNIVESYEYAKTIKRFGRAPSKRDSDSRPIARRLDNARSAERSFRRIVQANLVGTENPTLITLTFVQPLAYVASYRALGLFLQRLRRRVGPSLRYIAVPEFQKRGAVHYHILMWGIPEYVQKNERTARYLQSIWLNGFADLVVTNGHRRLARYLSKYMSKSLLDSRICGKKAYFTSRNTLRPVPLGADVEFSEMVDLGFIIAPNESLDHDYALVFQTMFLGECTYRRFLVSISPKTLEESLLKPPVPLQI